MNKAIAALLCLLAAAAHAQGDMSLSGQWQFFLARDARQADSVVLAGFGQPGYEAAAFVSTPVPSNWAVLGFEEPVYRGFSVKGQTDYSRDTASEGLYLKHFDAPATLKGQRVLLHFGGVWNSAEVWLNGHWLGRHDSGYTSFAMDASSALHPGQDNVLAVRVRQVYPGYKTDTYDDWTLGGIYRDVWLEAMPAQRRIDRVSVVTRMTGDVDVRVMVADEHKNTLPGNYRSPGEPYQLRLTLTDAEGREVAQRLVSVEGHPSNSRETRELLHVDGAHLWTAETPYLYMLRCELLEDGTATHERRQHVGIREISTEGGVLRINGQSVKLRGVNRHDEHPDVGRAVSRQHWIEDLRLMKQANINYVRACHYQHAKGFIELCDSMGMYVGAEVSLGGANRQMYDPNYLSQALLRVAETVERDRSNPSVIYWSVGNEDAFKEQLLQCVRVVKGLDPTRPVLLPWNADETLPEEVDILAPHYWTAHEYDSLAAQSRRPIITTEYVHAYGLQRMGGLEDCWRALTRHPAGAGGAVWMWADQGIRTPVRKDPKRYGSLAKDDDYLRLDSNGWDGITDSYRRPTRDYWEVKAVYCPISLTPNPIPEQSSPTRSLSPKKRSEVTLYNGYDFLNLNTVTIGWQTFTTQGLPVDSGRVVLDAEPHQTAKLAVNTRGADYLWLTFTDREGHELGRRSVELTGNEEFATAPQDTAAVADSSFFALHSSFFTLHSSLSETGLPQGFRPTVWHQLNDGDQIIKNRSFANNPERFTTEVRSIETDGAVTRSEVHYVVNDSNTIDARYTITRSAHALTIDYELTPRLQSTYVPIVGLAYRMQQPATLTYWYGLGPDEAYPNKQAATLLGLWPTEGMSGTRRMRWVDVDGLRLCCDGYLDRDTPDAPEIRLLSHVLGRPEKGRLNYPDLQLPQGKTYKGSITIVKQ